MVKSSVYTLRSTIPFFPYGLQTVIQILQTERSLNAPRGTKQRAGSTQRGKVNTKTDGEERVAVKERRRANMPLQVQHVRALCFRTGAS